MNTLLIYFILNSAMHWQFYAIEPIKGVHSRAYCEQMADNVSSVYHGEVGNMLVICTDDRRTDV